MCNGKTKQWHIKPKLAEYKTNVYCIVNKLKMVSKWDKMEEEVTTKVLTELTADLWSCEAVKVCKREGVDELGTHCHLVFATSGTEQLMIT